MVDKVRHEDWEMRQRIEAANQKPPVPTPDYEEYLERLFERGHFDD